MNSIKDRESSENIYESLASGESPVVDYEGVDIERADKVVMKKVYTDTYNRYKNYAEKMEAAFADIEIMKKVIAEHSEKLQKLA